MNKIYTKEQALELAEQFLKDNELDFGNTRTDFFSLKNELGFRIEAPNQWAVFVFVKVTLPCHDTELLNKIVVEMTKVVNNLDVDEKFNSLWSQEFDTLNNFTPGEFLRGLEEDLEYFKSKL